MSQPLLQCAGVMAVMRELVAARMPEHVRVNGEGELGHLADRGEQLAEGRWRHGPAPLGGEHVDALGHLLALQSAKGADLGTAKRCTLGRPFLRRVTW